MDKENRKSLTENEKRKLGFIIREYRKLKFDEKRKEGILIDNPYSKENVCENNKLCHYHTLTKLENDIVNEDNIYLQILPKLGLNYSVNTEEHFNNMKKLDNLLFKIFYAIEYVNDQTMKDIKNEVDIFDLSADCITREYTILFEFIYKLQFVQHIDLEFIEKVKQFLEFYDGLYKGLANHCLGIFYLNKFNFKTALSYLYEAQTIYQKYNLSIGLIKIHIFAVYNVILDYRVFELADELEKYYFNNKNYRRLLQIYTNKVDYSFLLNSYDEAKKNYLKIINILEHNEEFKRFAYYLHFNMGYGCSLINQDEDAYEYVNKAYLTCNVDSIQLHIINYLLILKTKLNHDHEEIKQILEKGNQYFDYGTEFEQKLFKYFKYKHENSSYYRRYAIEQIIPTLKNSPRKIDILLFIYQDLFKG